MAVHAVEVEGFLGERLLGKLNVVYGWGGGQWGRVPLVEGDVEGVALRHPHGSSVALAADIMIASPA